MSLENTQAQMRKGILEFCILSILEKKEAYPSEILETLKEAKQKKSNGNTETTTIFDLNVNKKPDQWSIS